MRLHVLFGQRKEAYDGEYAPEALLVWDEFAVDENPGRFEEEIQEQKQVLGAEMQAMRVICIDVDQDKIRQLLVKAPVVQGAIKEFA